jgi:hypothetical protein
MVGIGFPIGAKVATELGSGLMLASGLALAALTETPPSIDPTNLVTVVVAFLSAGGIGGLVARAMLTNWQKERDSERTREDEDRVQERTERERVLSLLERQNDYLREQLATERARIDQLVSRQYVGTQTVQHQVVKEQ